MQISAAASAATPRPASAPIVSELRRLAEIVSDKSSATLREKAEAYETFFKVEDASGSWDSSPASYARVSTQEERDEINALIFKSSFFKKVDEAATRFNAPLLAAGRSRTDGHYAAYNAFLKLSEDNQILVRTGIYKSMSSSVEDLKVKLKEQGDRHAAIEAQEQAKSQKSDKVTLTKGARTAIGLPAVADSEAEQALETLTAAPVETVATAALKTLQAAAEQRRAEADEKAKAERRQTPGLYRNGDNFSLDA